MPSSAGSSSSTSATRRNDRLLQHSAAAAEAAALPCENLGSLAAHGGADLDFIPLGAELDVVNQVFHGSLEIVPFVGQGRGEPNGAKPLEVFAKNSASV